MPDTADLDDALADLRQQSAAQRDRLDRIWRLPTAESEAAYFAGLASR